MGRALRPHRPATLNQSQWSFGGVFVPQPTTDHPGRPNVFYKNRSQWSIRDGAAEAPTPRGPARVGVDSGRPAAVASGAERAPPPACEPGGPRLLGARSPSVPGAKDGAGLAAALLQRCSSAGRLEKAANPFAPPARRSVCGGGTPPPPLPSPPSEAGGREVLSVRFAEVTSPAATRPVAATPRRPPPAEPAGPTPQPSPQQQEPRQAPPPQPVAATAEPAVAAPRAKPSPAPRPVAPWDRVDRPQVRPQAQQPQRELAAAPAPQQPLALALGRTRSAPCGLPDSSPPWGARRGAPPGPPRSSAWQGPPPPPVAPNTALRRGTQALPSGRMNFDGTTQADLGVGQTPDHYARREPNRTLHRGTQALPVGAMNIDGTTLGDLGRGVGAEHFARREPNKTLARGTVALPSGRMNIEGTTLGELGNMYTYMGPAP